MLRFILGLTLAVFVSSHAYAQSNWTGPYIGISAGYGSSGSSVVTSFAPNDRTSQSLTCGGNGGTCAQPMSNNFHGAFGGVQAGYNRQINSNWILGVEADISNSGIKGSGSNPVFKVASFPSTFRESENIRWFGTVRGRIGYAPADGFMVYGTGGFAYGREDSNASMTVLPQIGVTNIGASIPPYSFSCALGQACFSGNSSRIATGWTVGAGFEQKLWKNVSLKAEYLYVDLGDSGQTNVVAQQTLNPTDIASSFTANHSSTNFNVVRVGLNVKLGD